MLAKGGKGKIVPNESMLNEDILNGSSLSASLAPSALAAHSPYPGGAYQQLPRLVRYPDLSVVVLSANVRPCISPVMT